MPIKNTGKFSSKKEKAEKKHQTFTNIQFVPVYYDGTFKNIHLLYKMLPVLEDYADIFEDDSASPAKNYDEWLDVILNFIKDVTPWFLMVLVDNEPRGAVWVSAWEMTGNKVHGVEIGGLAARGVNPLISSATLQMFTQKLFDETDVYIVRAEFSNGNKSVKRILQRVGYSHLEERRCLKIKGGQEISGHYLSVTRPEWEALNESQKEEE